MVITRYKIKGPKLKAAVVSDLHGQYDMALIDALKTERPDVILIPGDLATIGERKNSDPNKSERWLQLQKAAIQFLKIAVDIAPVFYSRGNHEWGMDDEYREAVRSTGAVLLENKWVQFRDVWIGGLTSSKRYGLAKLTEEDRESDTEWLKNSPGGSYRLLLSHHPESYSLVEPYADLILSGHTHGAQIILFGHGLFAPGQGWFPRYSRGRYGKMIVSAGLTNTTWVPRINNPPELVIVQMG